MYKHTAVLLFFTILVGLIYVFPQIFFRSELGSRYQGLLLLGTPDEENYLIQLSEIYEGNFNIGNGLLYEHKQVKNGWVNFIPQLIAGKIGKSLGISLPDLVIFMNFFLPAGTYLLFFSLIYVLSTSYKGALVGSLMAMLSPHLFWPYSQILVKPLHLSQPFYVAFLPFNRPFNPQMGIIPLLLFLIFFYKSLTLPKLPRSLIWPIVSGVLLGINFYFYFFWAYLYPLVGIVLVLSLILKKPWLFFRSLVVLLTSIVIAAPALRATLLNLSGKTTALSLSNPFIATSTHRAIWQFINYVEALLVAVLVVLWWRKKLSTQTCILLSVLPLTGIAVMNQQILTGVMIQPHHYTLYLTPMMLVVVLTVIGVRIGREIGEIRVIRKIKRKKTIINVLAWGVCGTLGFFAVSEGIAYQSMSYHLISSPYTYMQNQVAVMNWLNQHSQPGSVIFGFINDMPLDQIPIYTANNLYVSLHARHYAEPSQEEFRDRLMNYAYLLGYDTHQFASAIADTGQFHYLFWGMRFFTPQPKGNYFTYDQNTLLPASLAQDWVEKYRQKLQKDIYQEVKTYRLDYVLYGPISKPDFQINPAFARYLSEVYRDNTYILYQVNHVE